MSNCQDFDEDSIPKRNRVYKNKCKVQKEEKIYVNDKKRILNAITRRVNEYYNFERKPMFKITKNVLKDILKHFEDVYKVDGKISLHDISNYIKDNFDKFEHILEKDDVHMFNNYSMFMWNIINNCSCKFKTIGEIHSGKCCICICEKDNMENLLCNHDFCSDCLSTISTKSSINVYCPLCRDDSSTIFTVNESNFISPLSIGERFRLINLCYDVFINHRKFCIGTTVIYVAKQLGYNISHITYEKNEKRMKSIKFNTRKQIEQREISNRIISEYDKEEWEE